MRTLCRTLSLGATLAAVALASGRAEAQDHGRSFAQQGAFIISADRLFGIYFLGKEETKQDVAGQTVTTTNSHTNIDLGATQPSNLLQAPRLALDYAVIPSLTIGTGLGYARYGNSIKTESSAGSQEHDAGTVSGYILTPRIGYAIPTGPVSIWLRGGLSFGNTKGESTNNNGVTTTDTFSVFDLSLEPTLAIMMTQSFGFLVGLHADIPLGGTHKIETSGTASANSHEDEYRVTNIGLTFGLVGQL